MAQTATGDAVAGTNNAEVATPEVISGGHLVAKALKAEGVDTIFTLCGGHIIDIYDGCVDEGIKVIDVRHEQVAAHAADGYARITGTAGCAVVTAGPGTTDAVTGVANAFRAESPMLLIGGQGSLSQHKMGSLQDLPHVDMMNPITKFAATVPGTARIADMVSMAFRECYVGAPGPSFLEIPRDVLDAKVPLESARIPQAGGYKASTRSAGDPAAIEKLADLLVHAQKPAILLGSQVWTTRGTDAAIDLVRTLNVPAYMNGAGRGTLPPGDPHHFQLSRRYAFNNADLIVIVGTPFDFRMGYGRRLSKDATVVQIDLDYRTVGKNRDIDLGIVGDVGVVLASVAQAASGRARTMARPDASSGWKNWPVSKTRPSRSGSRSCSPMPAPSTRTGWSARSTTSSPRTRSTSVTAATSSPSPARLCNPSRPATGWTRARSGPWGSAFPLSSRQNTPARTRKWSRCSVTAPSA
nr:thiamine pyrophosphate-binding protein [Fodinicola feengrottensis]